jgi:hypothetical protein
MAGRGSVSIGMRWMGGLAALALSGIVAQAQGCGSNLAGASTLQGRAFAVAFRSAPAKIATGKRFSLDLVVCPIDGAAPPDAVRVDAFMPEHQHGMNYKPAVKALGAGHFHADGLMFHMPGRWELRFDIKRDGRSERLTSTVLLK